MKKFLFKGLSLFLSLACFITFTFNGLSIASAESVESASLVNSGSLAAPNSSMSASSFSLKSFKTDLFTGKSSFTIPIIVPSGRKGLAPELVLNYTGQPHNDWCGVGWDLDLEAISRSTKDGIPKYTGEDKFLFNGSELVKITGNEYRLKTDSAFTRFISYGNYWEVIDKSGTKYRFGYNDDAKLTTSSGMFKWYLDRVTDTCGNYISISYLKDQAEVYLSQIKYTGNDNTGDTPLYTINFKLEPRTDVIIDYTAGQKCITAYRLKEIEELDQSSLIRRYILNYKYSSVTNRSLLENIVLYGSDGSTTLNPISFQYQETLPVINPPSANCLNNFKGTPLLGDFNGDGLTDIAAYSESAWSVALNNNGQFSSGIAWVYTTTGEYKWSYFTGDFNGDGYVDLGAIVSDKQWIPPKYWKCKVALSTSSSFAGGFTDWCDIFGNISMLGDINGDGKTDIVIRHYSDIIANGNITYDVYLSTGSNFSFWKSLTFQTAGYSLNSGDFNGDGLMDMLISDSAGSQWKVVLSPFTSSGSLSPQVWLSNFGVGKNIICADVNSDGLTDIVDFDPDTGQWKAAVSDGTKFIQINDWTNNFGNGKIPIAGEFGLNGLSVPGTYDFNNGAWQIAQTNSLKTDFLNKIENGTGGSIDITYKTHQERTVPFIDQVVDSIMEDDGLGNSYTMRYDYSGGSYDRSQREYRGFNYGKVTDPKGNYSETYFRQDAVLKGKPYLEQTKNAAGNLFLKKENSWSYNEPFPGVYNIYLQEENSYIYEGGASSRHTRANYTYDNYGNIVRIYNQGDVEISGDEKEVITEYAYNTSNWILSLPCHIYARDSVANKASEKWLYYDNHSIFTDTPEKGLLTKQEAWLNTGGGNPYTLYAYDSFGNVISVTDALGRTASTEYDSTYHLFPVKVTNAKNHTASSTYDTRTGQVLTVTDANNQTTTNKYDSLGRIIKVIGPNDTQAYPGVSFEYDLNSVPTKITTLKRIISNTDSVYTTYSFYDGMGRCIQAKSPAEDINQQIVDNIVVFDERGLVKEKYFSYLVDSTASYMIPNCSQPKTAFEYDPLGRLIQTTEPDGTISKTIYEPDRATNILEYSGSQLQKAVSYFDAYGQLIKKEENNQGQIYTTTYEYDTLGNLIKLTDNQNNITTINYDSLGRKTSMNDPDMGAWSYTYDKVGNLFSQTDAKGQTINFSYDELNRLFLKTYSTTSQSVTYEYDDPAKDYCLGRLSRITDSSGRTEFYYDNLGREIKSEKTIDGITYPVLREYDGLDRLTKLTYSDGEVVSYNYNNSGAIESVYSQTKGSYYVTSIDYNAKGQMTHINYGNGTYTDYEYNPLTLRLNHLSTNGGALQNLFYTFDHKDNIISLSDSAYGTQQNFQYDDLNRLTSATGTNYGTINYTYDSIGNLKQKNNILYQYGTPDAKKPHAVTKYGDINIAYDANGNMRIKDILQFDYDPENRLIRVEDTTYLPSTAQITLNLSPGWNFISFPIKFTDSKISSVLAPIAGKYDQVSRYNPEAQKFEHYVGNPDYDQFNSFEYGRGYEIYVKQACTLTLSGTVPKNEKITLKAGLNLIANPKPESTATEEALKTLQKGLDYDTVWRYNTTTGFFENVTDSQLEPGKSYYVNILQDTEWTANKVLGTTTYRYDGDGGRVKKTWADGRGTTDETIYIGSLYEKETSNQSTVTRKHIFLGSNRICTVNSQLSSVNYFYYHTDHLGSSSVITNQTGQVVQHTAYEPYGKVASQSTSTPATSYLFTGKELDASTGLYFYGARYYDPELCRFIQADTIVPSPGNPQSLNRYSYCDNNPVNYTDPTGHGKLKDLLKKAGDFFKDLWEDIKKPVLAAAVVITSFMFTGGLAALSMRAAWIAAGSAGFTTMGLGTGEGRQLINRVAKEFFDDVLGMRPGTARIWSAVGLHIAGTWGLERLGAKMFLPNGELQAGQWDGSDPNGGTLQGEDTFFGPDPIDSPRHINLKTGKSIGRFTKDELFTLTDTAGQSAGTLGVAPLDGFFGDVLKWQHTGVNINTLSTNLSSWNTFSYLTHGVCHQAANATMALGGYSSTLITLGKGGYATSLSTAIYGNYGGQLGNRIYTGMSADD